VVPRIAIALGTLLLAIAAPGRAAAQGPSEYAVKAAFLFKFTDYVEWPDDSKGTSAPFVVAILGSDPFGNVLDEMLTGKTVRGRRVVARRFATDAEALREADIVFIGLAQRPDVVRVLRSFDGRPVLTVGESEHFAAEGGIVGFRLQGSVIRFDINREQAEKAGLRISSQLLKLARIVRTGSER
jgi:YfiR/HmsC-like